MANKNGKRKSSNGIKTVELNNGEYFKIYRAKDLEEQVKIASELDVIDRKFYKKLINALKLDPELRNILNLAMICIIFDASIFLFKASAILL